jgi:DNA-binding beta-propeller fold protein YncE
VQIMRVLVAAVVAILAAGCATTSAHRDVLWPAPPATARIRFVRTLGSESDLDGSARSFWRSLTGSAPANHLYHPVGVAVTRDGNHLYVTDQALGELFAFDLAGRSVNTITRDRLGGVAIGVTVDDEGDVWTVIPDRKLVIRLAPDLRMIGGFEMKEADRPTTVAVDRALGRVFVGDTSGTKGEGHAVRVFDLTGKPLAVWGKKGAGPGEFFFPTFVAVRDGKVYVADTLNARVQVLDEESGQPVGMVGERGDRIGHFDKPKGLAFDSFGNLYVADSFWSNVQIFNERGQVLLFFGGRGDSPGFLSNPAGMAIDGHNHIYVSNPLNFRIEVYELINTTARDSDASTPPIVAGTEGGK